MVSIPIYILIFCNSTAGLAMDWRVGLRWHFCCSCPNSKPRPVFDFSSKNQGSFFNFFKKWKNELVRPKMMFLAILARIWSFSDNSDTLANSRLTNIELVCAYESKEFSKKLFVRTSCRLYLVFQSRSIKINFQEKTQQLGFLKNQFAARLRRLRSTWDIHIRAFDEAHPTVLTGV